MERGSPGKLQAKKNKKNLTGHTEVMGALNGAKSTKPVHGAKIQAVLVLLPLVIQIS